mmetsp:Transcript_61664/g.133560  ORF Transcript_61664/g.133560 Transcript_61664/m.133560 type:complete len:688 (-) Transcript_61664:64-2127(-)|eukprot:CAMPEP_0170575640 /NCGR_PEP_ID=MMETSP0224-20130122/3970_1 /TAXON_ID=285029 /ORGANISM="Togula jolla, Strain CCCM 725" /LENGTH=687 /DNA_ID=CAMNT_0010898435 /DNA_START=68 /DNA_END=2131 /DNA_ORIENTATION=+
MNRALLSSSQEASQNWGSDLEASTEHSTKTTDDSFTLFRRGVAPQRIFRIIATVYSVIFVMNRVADVAYLANLECSFPEGLQYLDTVAARARCLDYTRQTVHASMARSTATFVLVMLLVCTGFLARLDSCLSGIFAIIEDVLNFLQQGMMNVVGRNCCLGACFSGFSCIFGTLQRCCCCWTRCIKLDVNRLLQGAVFLVLLSATFFLLDVPFEIWMHNIDAKFGFSNVVTTPMANFKDSLIQGFISVLLFGIPSSAAYLAVVSYRYGWVLLWGGMVTIQCAVQYNAGRLGPMLLGPSSVFPDSDFGVGHGFPLAVSEDQSHPLVALDRIYYPGNASDSFLTHDLSRGQVNLSSLAEKPGASATWEFTSEELNAKNATEVYGRTVGKVAAHKAGHGLEALEAAGWTVGDAPAADGKVGVRHGKQLRDELFGFADERGIVIDEVYMIDGSYKDARANAFAAGAGRSRVIGLYDTLFLGEPSSANSSVSKGKVEAFSSVRKMGNWLHGVHPTELGERPVWHSAPVQSMTDDEILAIMGHELGHSAMHHVEHGMVREMATSFITFAALGWIVHSPMIVGAFSLAAPAAHIAVFVYSHMLSPTMDHIIGIFNNALSRSNEFAADAYSARVSKKYADGLQTALAKLTVNCNADPASPWYWEVLHDDHPTTAQRWAHVEALKRELYPETPEKKG